MADNSPNSIFAPIPENAGALSQVLNLPASGSVPVQQNNVDIAKLVDPRKVSLAREMGTLDGLNDVEVDFATKSVADNAAKYGDRAYAVDSNIRSTAVNDVATSQLDRSPGELIGDTSVGVINGGLQGLAGTAQAINTISPLNRFGNLITNGKSDALVSEALSGFSNGVQSLADRFTSDTTLQAREIKNYKNMLDEARHAREEQEAIANGESAIAAGTARIAKDAWSALDNMFSSTAALADVGSNTLGSLAGMGGYTTLAKAGARGLTALAEKTANGAKKLVTPAKKVTAENIFPSATNPAMEKALAGGVVSTAGKNTAQEAGILEKILTNPMTAVGLQEGGGAGLQAFDTVNNMSDDELTQSSEMYRELKSQYLAQGLPEEEASAQAKMDVANSATNLTTVTAGLMAAPMGKLLDKAWIKTPFSQFANGSIKRTAQESLEEGLEGFNQIGSNYVAANTYNNNQDLLEGVGTNIGEGMGGAGIGTGVAGAPSMLKNSIKSSFRKTANAVKNTVENASTNKKINTINESKADIDDAINNINAANTTSTTGTTAEATSSTATSTNTSTSASTNTAEASTVNSAFTDPDNLNKTEKTTVKPQDKNVDATNGNLSTKTGAEDSLKKIKDVATATIGEDGAKKYEKVLNTKGIAPNTRKLDIFHTMVDYTDKLLNVSDLTDDAKLSTLRVVDTLNDLHKELFQAQPLENITAQISDDTAKQAITKAYNAYAKLGANKKYQNAVKTAVRFAKEQTDANNDFDKILADNTLTDEQKDKAIARTVEAYKFLVKNKIANDTELNKAKEVAKNIKDDDERVFFLDEINQLEQQRADVRKVEDETKNFASDIDHLLQHYAKEKDFTKENSHKKSMLEVSAEKLRTLYDPAVTNRRSFASLNLQMLARMSEGDVDGARQIMYDHMNFIQSQINKFNAWRKSKADNLVANKGITDTSKRVQAKPETYSTYNPKTHEWETSDRGIHGGSIELGAVMLKEANLLKNQFNALKALYFQNDPNLNLVENSNSTVTDDYIKKEYAKYLKYSGKEDLIKLLDTTPELDKTGSQQPAEAQNQAKDSSNNTNQSQNQNQNQSQPANSVNVQATASANPAQQKQATPEAAKPNTTATNSGKGGDANKPGTEPLNKGTENGTKGAVDQHLANQTKQPQDQKNQVQQPSAGTANTTQNTASNQQPTTPNSKVSSVFANVFNTNGTGSKKADVSYKNSILTNIKNKLFGLTTKSANSVSTTYLQDMQAKLGNIINTTNVSHVSELSVEDASALFNALDTENIKSPISQFFGALTKRLLPFNDNCLVNLKKDYAIDLSENSVLVKNKLINITGNEKVPYKISYRQAVDLFEQHPEVIEELSDAELSAIYNTFPTLSLMELELVPNLNTYKLQLNQELATKLFLSSVAFWNQSQFTGSQDWERLAETFNFNLMDVVNKHDADGKPVGIYFMERLASGMTTEGIVRGLTSDLRKVLGVKFDQDNVSYETSNTFYRVLAGSIITALKDNGVIQEFSNKNVANDMGVYSLAHDPADNKVISTIFSSLKNPEGLDKILGTDRAENTGAIYVSGSPEASQIAKSTRNTYEHSNIELPKNIREARDIIEETEYFLDENMLNIYKNLGEEGLIDLYGQGKLDPATMDIADFTSKKGKNLVIAGAWKALQKWVDQMQEVAKDANVPLSKVCKRFKLGITTVNRIQELEAYGPIANKLVREVLSATWGEVKIKGAKKEDQVDIARAVMQNFGAKLNRTNRDTTVKAFRDLLNSIKKDKDKFSNLLTLAESKNVKIDTVKEAMKEINNFLAYGDNGNPTKSIKALGLDSIDKSFMSLHAMQTLAIYANASMAKNKPDSIKVNLYCEGDGTTNGSANGNMLYTNSLYDEFGNLSTYFLESLDMANMRVGDHSGKSAGEIKEKTPKGQRDLYEYSGAVSETNIKQDLNDLNYGKNANSTWNVEERQYGDVSANALIKSISDFFQLSGVTDNLFTPLQKAISRNFMKKPCTKGGYGAGLTSINNSLVAPLIDNLHEMRSRVLKAEANAKKQNKNSISKKEIALAAFGDMYENFTKKHPNTDMSAFLSAEEQQKYQGATLKDVICVKMFENYLKTLNTLAQNKLTITKNEQNNRLLVKSTFTFTPSTESFNTTKITKQGKYGPYNKIVLKPITYESFLSHQGKDSASINFDQEVLDNIRNNIQKVYGEPIFRSIQKSIRSNISPAQATMQNVSTLGSLINNFVRLARIATLPKNASIKTVNDKFTNFSKTNSILNNILNFGDTRVSLAESERVSEGALKGGSIYDEKMFTKYDGTTNSKYTFSDKGFNAQTYDMYANPGVRILPTTTISLGDASMMANFATQHLKKLGHNATLIFDGLNAPIGKQKEYGEAINQVQYETDQVNPLETFLDKLHDLISLSENPADKEELITAYQLIADAMALKEGAYTEAGVNSFISLFFQNTNDQNDNFSKRVNTLCQTLNDELYGTSASEQKARQHHSHDVFTPSMFTPRNANCLAFRKTSRDFVRKEILKKYGKNSVFTANGWDKTIQQAIAKNSDKLGDDEKNILAYLVKTGYLAAPTKTLADGSPNYRSALVAKQRDILKRILSVFTDSKEVVATGSQENTISIENLVNTILKDSYTNCFDVSAGISELKTAIYLMGGTYDHMASLDAPYVALPTKSKFKETLEKYHLVPKNGYTADSLWDVLMEGDQSPNTALQQLNDRVNSSKTQTIWSSPTIVKERTKILQQIVDTLKANTTYEPKFITKKYSSEIFAQKSYAPNTKTTSVKEILTSETIPTSVRNRLNMFADTYNEGKPLHTKFYTFTGKTPANAADSLKAKYSDDIAKVNERIAKQNQENTQWNDEHKDAIAFGKVEAKTIKPHLTTDSAFAAVDNYVKNSGKNGVQFYDEATDAIYTIPTTSSGIETKVEETRTKSDRYPHEIFHALTNKALSYVGKLLDDGKTPQTFTDLASKTKDIAKAAHYKRQAIALKAYNRLASLKQQVDNLLPDDISKLPDECFQLKLYIQNIKNNPNMSEGAKIKEFAAYFGTMSQQEQNIVLNGLTADSAEIKSLRDLASDTQKDVSILQKLIQAVKTAFADFISKIFGSETNSTLVQDIIHGNVLILNTVQTANRLENGTKATLDLNIPANTNTTANFLEETADTSFDPEVDVSSEGTATPRTEASDGVVQNATLKDLSNSLIEAVKQNLASTIKVTKKNGSIQSRNELLKKFGQLIALKNRMAPQNGKDFSILEDVISPLENYGFQISDKKSFANVVNILSYIKDIKTPYYGEIVFAAKHIMNQLTPEDFCSDPHDQAQLAKGADIVKFLQGIDKGSLTPDLITPVIFALSQSDANFAKILSKMKINRSKNNDDYLYFDKIFNKAANNIAKTLNNLQNKPLSESQQEHLTNLVGRMARDERDFSKSNFVQDSVAIVEGLISNGLTAIAKAVANKFNIPYEGIKDLPIYIENQLNNSKYAPHFVTEALHDVLGSTSKNYEFYSWNRKAKNSIQQNRQQAIEKTPIAIKELFNNSLSDEQWSSFTKTIGKSSLSTLYRGDIEELAQLLENASSYKNAIATEENAITDSYRINKCKQLANYMMTGKAGKMLLRNPVAIANRLGKQFGYRASDAEIKACDRLTSLYALEHLTKKEKTELASLLRTESTGMHKLLNMAKSQQTQGANKAKDLNKTKYNWYKGNVPNNYLNAKHFKVARMSNQKDMERMGYTLVREYSGANLDGVKLGIFYSKFNHTNPFNPGALTFTVSTANGITASGSSLRPNAGMISDPTIVKYITKNMGNYTSANNEELVPVFNADGTVIAYERTLDPELLNDAKYLTLRTDYAELLGIQEGRNTEESLINEFNTAIVDHLVDRYNKANVNEKDAYVDLYSIKDPVVSTITGMFPTALRDYIAEKSGSDSFMVLRSEINDIIGYHSASITDSWTGESRLPEAVQELVVKSCETILGKNAYSYLKIMENAERSLVKTAKNNIIIRSLVVPTMNIVANMIQLVNEGVPVQTIINYTPQVIKELNRYVKFTTELLKIRQELNGETTGYRKHQLKAQEAVLVDGLNHLSIGYLLQQKEFSAIADLGNNNRDLDLTEGSIGDKILAQIDKLSENELVRSITHYGFLAPDTSLYKLMEKANQYGDFLGKAILYKDLTSRKGLTPEEAHKIVADEFVDYVRLPGRGRDFLERAGLLWFYNFKLRMVKVAMRNLKEHPLTSLALTLGGLPTPTADSMLGKLPVLNYTIGPGMLLSAFCATPFTAIFALL